MRSEQSRYLAVLLGGLVIGLAVVFLSIYTALNRPFEIASGSDLSWGLGAGYNFTDNISVVV